MRLRDIRTNLHRLSSRTLTRSPSSLHPDATAGQPTPLGQRFLRRRAYASYGSALTPTDLLGVCLVAPTSTGLLADAFRRAHPVRLIPWRAPRTAPGLRHIPHVPQPRAPRWRPSYKNSLLTRTHMPRNMLRPGKGCLTYRTLVVAAHGV